MVNVMKGVLIECDPAMKQFLLHLDEKVRIGNFNNDANFKFHTRSLDLPTEPLKRHQPLFIA